MTENSKKVQLLSFSDKSGGAAIAALKYYIALADKFDVEMLVAQKKTNIDRVIGPTRKQYWFHFGLRILSFFATKIFCTKGDTKRSANLFSSSSVTSRINCNGDVLHIHWINNDTVSLSKLKKLFDSNIKTKILTLHDDWFYCASEHYSLDRDDFINGYVFLKNRMFSLDRYIYDCKLKFKPYVDSGEVVFTAPSFWMRDRARTSYLLRNGRVEYLPNIIDTNLFKPAESNIETRNELNIPNDSILLCFGAVGGTTNYIKGYDLLEQALLALNNRLSSNEKSKIRLLIFGGNSVGAAKEFGFKAIYTGHIGDPSELARLYSASDLVIVPSRIESFGQVAAESLACETPVVCFDNSAVAEIVDDGVSGFTAKAFDSLDLANKILDYIRLDSHRKTEFGRKGRIKMIDNYSSAAVCRLLEKLYV
ncbi:glycosyltransferase mshA [Vibrio sp. JCM 19236]|nr:glycosyltransferase mshA [Vibrio sp. JCM 19236]